MTQKECVQVVRAAGFSGYDKSLDSKANNPGKYGVQRTAEAQAALDAVATARNGGLPAKQCKRSGDRHKLPHRISARFTREQAERIKEAVIMSDKFKQYVGSLLASTSNPETGENPVFGQLAQGSLQPHVDKMRMTATQFSAATGLTITDVGIINDANPTSSDAILAQSQTLVLMAQQLNTGNGDALKTIIQMAQAIVRDVRLDELTTEELDIMPHFKNPAMPSVAVTADAAIKIASARKEFSSTDTFLEMIGFDQADIRRIKAQEQRVRGQQLIVEVDNADNGEYVD